MRPDIEEFDELNENQDAPRSRAMSWVVLGVAVGGFAALAYYAYHSGTAPVDEQNLMTVEADATPIKEAPLDPEGEQFANKDKTIYDVISPAPGGDDKVEKLLPDPEKPVAVHDARDVEDDDVDATAPAVVSPSVPADASSPTTFVNKGADAAKPTVDPVDVQSMKQPAPAEAAKTPAPAEPVVKPVEEKLAVGEPNFVNTPVAAKKDTAVVPVVEKKETAKPVVKEAPKAVEKKAAPTVAASGNGAYKVQLGAFQSEEDALAQWKKVTAKFGDVIGGAPIVVKAELDNGTFYRLRAGGFASPEAAKVACAKLSAKGQACFPAGK